MKLKSLVLLALLSQQTFVSGQGKGRIFHSAKPKAAALAPPVKSEPPLPYGMRPYKEVINDQAKTDKGLFKVHNVQDRYFMEIPDSLLGRDILVVNRISKGAAGVRASMMGYAGDQIGDNVIRFEKGPQNKLFLKSISFNERSADTTGMYKSVLNSSVQPIVASFDIRTWAEDTVSRQKSYVIDIQDYLNGDNDVFFFNPWVKNMLSITSLLNDRSYIQQIRSFPANIEIRTVKTFLKNNQSFPGMPPLPPSPVTFELNSSMVLLPRVPMKARYFDPRIGYFSTGYVDFDANPHGVKQVAMITRFKLEPKLEDVEKYKRGELVEPAKPIVFYIDPATPRKWVPYLVQGVKDWQVAFEKAGFKNAIMAKEPPKDPNWSIDDASHNAIVYKPSDVPNASGPHVHDPRSGEIIETHINWYHSIMTLVRNWYMVQTAAVDPGARKLNFDDELVGQLIRSVASHEVGHTLGLRHNFGSSSTVPVDSLRNNAWLDAHGHTPSIMDYARFNYVAQPSDKVSRKNLFARIGDYDIWAIEWGYRWMPEYKSAAEEVAPLNKMIVERLSKNKRLWFGTEYDADDPRCQNEDLGNNSVLASQYGIKNLKRLIPNILNWTRQPNEGYENSAMIYKETINQFGQYVRHISRNVGGTYNTPKTVEEKGKVYEQVPYSRQKEAIAFLNTNLFNTPVWLINKDLISLAGVDPISSIKNLQTQALGQLLSLRTLSKLTSAEALYGREVYTTAELFKDLRAGIWTELGRNSEIDLYRRNLQKSYIESLFKIIVPAGPAGGPDASTTDVSSIVRAHLVDLQKQISSASYLNRGSSKYHLQDLSARIRNVLNELGFNKTQA
ncbi:zinc-dependent metalloprotease [Desertivirga brevis]|uniref:zinc-dependent metalloprotease n=1 Tax=Desertivirga brevis TaxID=2810310 RepID=UPI001A957DF6|nr:zinc-dependent metalloprotease [Pedobacter sp. SYSU D00873]